MISLLGEGWCWKRTQGIPFCQSLDAFSYQTQLQKVPKSLWRSWTHCKDSRNGILSKVPAEKRGSQKFKDKKNNKQVTWSPFSCISFKAKTFKVLVHVFSLPEHWSKSRELAHSRVLPCREQDQFPAPVTPSLGPEWGCREEICFVSLNNGFYS